MRKPTTRRSELGYTLPAALNRDIGRIIVHWSYFELLVQSIIWDLVGVDDRVGRLAIRTPRIGDSLDLIRDLSALHGLKIDKQAFSKTKSLANEASQKRDILAHGGFTRESNGHWYVVQFSGTWPKDSFQTRTSRRVQPEILKLEANGLKEIITGIESLIAWAMKFPKPPYGTQSTSP